MPNPRLRKKAEHTISRASNRPAAKPMSKPAARPATPEGGGPNPPGAGRGAPGGGALQSPAPPQLQSMRQAIQSAGGDPSGGAIAKPFPGAGGAAPDMPDNLGMGMGGGMAGAPPGAPPMLPPVLQRGPGPGAASPLDGGAAAMNGGAPPAWQQLQSMGMGGQGSAAANKAKLAQVNGLLGVPQGPGGNPSAPMQSAPPMPGAPPTLQGPPMPPRPGAEPALGGGMPRGLSMPNQFGANGTPMLPPAIMQMLQEQGAGGQGGPQGPFGMTMPRALPGGPQGQLDPRTIMDGGAQGVVPPGLPRRPQDIQGGGQGLAGPRRY